MVWSLNSTIHAGLGVSPFEADYGRRPYQPFDSLNPVGLTDDPPLFCRAKVDDKLSAEQGRKAVDRLVREALNVAKSKQKKYADEKRRPPEKYSVGDRVVVSTEALMSHEDRELLKVTGRKLGPLFIGPYKIVADTGHNTLKLQLPSSMKAHDVVNVEWVKPYKADGSFGRPRRLSWRAEYTSSRKQSRSMK